MDVYERQRLERGLASLTSMLASRWRVVSLVLIPVAFAASLVIVWVLRAFPNSADEYGYIYEAWTFLAGRLWNPLPPHHEFFSFLHIFEKDGKWVSAYTFGWSAQLAVAGLLHLPFWLVCPITGAMLLLTLAKLAQRQNGALGAVLTLLLIAPSPFFLFNAASYFNAVPTALGGALFCWAAADFLDNPSAYNGILAGAALGWAGVTRTYDAFIFLVPFAIQFFRVAHARHYLFAATIGLGGLPFLAGLLLYNRAITGSALLSVISWGYPLFTFGLYPADAAGNHSNPAMQLLLALYNIGDLVPWTSPFLVAGYIVAFRRKIAAKTLAFYDFIFPLAVIGYFFFNGLGGNRYGPRYYFVGYPFLVLTVVSVLVPILKDKAHLRRVQFSMGLITAHVLFCLIATVRLGIFFRGVVNERMDMYEQVKAEKIHNAIVIVQSAGGTYLPFTPKDLTRNGISIDHQDVLYALDIPGRMSELERAFPGREFYVYSRKIGTTEGKLRALRIEDPVRPDSARPWP
jgi:hypothetical protein